jgi:hypothetical protein
MDGDPYPTPAGGVADIGADEWVNRLPVCAITFEPAAPTYRDAIAFDSHAVDPDQTSVAVHWDFGDGGAGEGPVAGHRYRSPGAYQVCAMVTDELGATASCCALVTVGCECNLALVSAWCRMTGGRVGQTRRGMIAAWNLGDLPCDAVLRVTNGAGGVVFEETRTMLPFRPMVVGFSHRFTADDVGRQAWRWEVLPADCPERTPLNNATTRTVNVSAAR